MCTIYRLKIKKIFYLTVSAQHHISISVQEINVLIAEGKKREYSVLPGQILEQKKNLERLEGSKIKNEMRHKRKREIMKDIIEVVQCGS